MADDNKQSERTRSLTRLSPLQKGVPLTKTGNDPVQLPAPADDTADVKERKKTLPEKVLEAVTISGVGVAAGHFVEWVNTVQVQLSRSEKAEVIQAVNSVRCLEARTDEITVVACEITGTTGADRKAEVSSIWKDALTEAFKEGSKELVKGAFAHAGVSGITALIAGALKKRSAEAHNPEAELLARVAGAVSDQLKKPESKQLSLLETGVALAMPEWKGRLDAVNMVSLDEVRKRVGLTPDQARSIFLAFGAIPLKDRWLWPTELPAMNG